MGMPRCRLTAAGQGMLACSRCPLQVRDQRSPDKHGTDLFVGCPKGDVPASLSQERPVTLRTRIANATQAVGRVANSAACGAQVLVSADVRRQRQEACDGCPKEHADPVLGIKWCGVCGCALGVKQRLATETCPLGRWPTDNLPAAETGPSAAS